MRAFWHDLGPEGRWFLSTTAATHLGRGMTLPFTIIYTNEVRGIPLDTAGLLMGLIAVVALVLTGPVGMATDRFGARVMILGGSLAQVLGAIVIAFATTVPSFILGFVLFGISMGVGWPAFNAMIAAIVKGPLRTQFFGVNFALLNAGIGVGGIIGGFVVDVERPETFTAVFLADAACMLIPIALLLGPLRHVHARAVHPEHQGAGGQTSYVAIIRQPAMLWITALSFIWSFVGYGQMEGGFPAFARQVSEVSTRTIGFAFAVNTVTIVSLQFVVLRFIHQRRRTAVLVWLAAVWGASWALLGLTGLVPGTVLATVGVLAFLALFGLGETLLQPTMPAIVNDLASDHLRGRYNAVSAGSFQLGAIAAPAYAGVLLHANRPTLFIASLLVGCALMAVLALRVRRHISASVDGVDELTGAPTGSP